MKQRLIGVAALLTLGALMAGVPWLFIFVATRVRIRLDLTNAEGWWQALTTRDDGTLLIWAALILGTLAWAVLAIAVVVEIISRLRHVSVPRLRGFAVPQAIAHGLVAAAIGAILASNTLTTGAVDAHAAPGPLPADPGPAPSYVPAAPASRPDTGKPKKHDEHNLYVVKKGDTLWDIADDKLGDPYRYPEIFKASKKTVQPDGRRLVNPDLIYPGWELTIPAKAEKPKPAAQPDTAEETEQAPATATPPPIEAEETLLPATPAATSTSQPEPTTAPRDTEQAQPTQQSDDVEDDDAGQVAPLPWMLAGLGGAGALLAGSLWLSLRHHRAAQFRFRRPGHTIAVSNEPALAVVEQTLMHQGDLTSELVERIAQTTQRLATRLQATGSSIPTLLGIDATFAQLTFRFADPTDLPEPWASTGDPSEWSLPAEADLDLVGPWDEENEPVWPTLVTLGQDDRGWRLLNLETLGAITLTGDQTNAHDLVRYWIAELSVTHWARDVEIAHGELFSELTPLIRHRFWDYTGDDATDGLTAAATTNDTYLAEDNLPTIDAGRASQTGPVLWLPRVLIAASNSPGLDELTDLVTSHPRRTGVTIVRLDASDPSAAGVEVRLTDTGRVQVPALGLDLIANGITADEAAGCAALLATGDDLSSDAPMPNAAESVADWQQHCDAAGHLHADLTIPRATVLSALEATSLLPQADRVYVTETASTEEDLAELAPMVPAATTANVRGADLALDQDLADWRADSTDRPRITVLGPVRLRLGRYGRPTAGVKQVAYFAELAAYLATRPNGATTDELMEALGVSAQRARVVLHTLRARLGSNPDTGRYFLPYASDNREAEARNEGVYVLQGALYDADLFRRLRLRGEASGVAGIDDLAAALRLVTGAPYEQLRRRGGLWLAKSRDDQHLLVSIVDVAHLVTTHAVAEDDLRRARAAAELAHAIAPYEATPQLDLAVIAEHEGRPVEVDQMARGLTGWLDGTGDGPVDLSQRADAILRAHRWLDREDRVG